MREILYFLESETKVANMTRLKPSFPNFTRGLVSAILLLLLFFGCGGGDSKSETETKISMQIPIKIDIEIPDVITIDDDEYREHTGGQEKSRDERLDDENNYKQIKPITLTIERLFDETKFNISIANSAMRKIEEHCKDTPLNEVCKISKETFEFSFDKQIVDELTGYVSREQISDIDTESLIGKSVYFGSIEFVRHDGNSTYAYSLMMDSSNIENIFFSEKEPKSYIRTIKWAKDNSKLFYASSSLDLVDIDTTTLYYQNIPNIGESAHLTFFYADESASTNKYDIFDLSRENNSTDFFLKINSQYRGDINSYGAELTEINTFYKKHSYLEISEEKGYLYTNYLGVYAIKSLEDGVEGYGASMANEIYQKIFDKNGVVEATRYCPGFDLITDDWRECDDDNKSTWFRDSDESVFEPFDKWFFRVISISYGDEENLTNGEYFLIPTEQNITGLTIEDALKYSIASFVVLEDMKIYGYVHDKSYPNTYNSDVSDRLNRLQVVRAKYNHDLNLSLSKRVEEFEVLTEEDKPELY